MIDRSRLGVAGVAGAALMTLLTLVFLLTPRAHSFNVAGLGTYAVNADAGGLPIAILGGTSVTDPNSGPADTAATPEAGETLGVDRHSKGGGLTMQDLSIQKRFNMTNAPGGAGLGNWTLTIRSNNSISSGNIEDINLYAYHWCLESLFGAAVSAETSNITATSLTLYSVDIRMRQGGYFAPVTSPSIDPPCAAPAV